MKRMLLVVLAAAMLLCMLVGCDTLTLDSKATGTIVYLFGGVSFRDELSPAEVATVVGILDGKLELADEPPCVFSEYIAFTINGVSFELACDDCGVVRNSSTGMYITISDAERDALEELFISRGGNLPCV